MTETRNAAGQLHPGGTRAGLVLASASETRARIMRDAGLAFVSDPAGIDEAELKASLAADGADAGRAAALLAELKARQVSRRHPGALIIGADQLLDCDGEWYDKPADMTRARADLLALRGRAHQLWTAVCVVRDGAILWHHEDQATMTMRHFGEAFVDSYLRTVGPEALASVGAYRLEGPGAQLFSGVVGDYFTILGLPLLPLLEFLRGHGVVDR